MNPRRGLLIAASTGLALLITTGAYYFDAWRVQERQTAVALQLSRQIAAQAEGLAFEQKRLGRKNALGRAVEILTQGPEPRALTIQKFEATAGQATESYAMDTHRGIFEFKKVVTPEEGEGIRIRIHLAYEGFLGAQNRFTHDLMVLSVFAAFLGLFLLGLREWFERESREQQSTFKEYLRAWVGEAKEILTRLGFHMREMLREAAHLAAAAGKSRELVTQMRENIHNGLNEVTQHCRSYRQIQKDENRAEALSLNLAIEAAKTEGEGSRLTEMAEQLHREIQRLKQINSRAFEAIRAVEKKLEGWATDADVAHHAFDDVFRATNGLNAHVTKTKDTMIGQARQMQNITNRLAAESAGDKVVGGRRR